MRRQSRVAAAELTTPAFAAADAAMPRARPTSRRLLATPPIGHRLPPFAIMPRPCVGIAGARVRHTAAGAEHSASRGFDFDADAEHQPPHIAHLAAAAHFTPDATMSRRSKRAYG